MADTRPARRPVDLLTLVAAVGTLLVAGYLLTGGNAWLPDMRWVLAGAAAVAGVVLLATSVRRGND